MARFLAIEWNDTEARLAVASSRGTQVAIEQAFTVALPAPTEGNGRAATDVGAAIAAAVAERGIGRLDTLVSVGRANIELRQVSVPPCPDEELPDLVRFQSMKEFTGLQEDWPLDFVPIDESAQQARRVLAAAIDPQVLQQIQQTCQSAGLKLRRMVLRPCAAASLLQRRTEPGAARIRLLIDLLGDEADLTVLIDRKVVFLRTMRLPGDPLTASESAQALLGEIRRTMAAAQNQLDSRRVESVVLCGARPKHATLADSMGQQLGMPAELFDPFAGLQLEGGLRQALPEHPGRFAPLLGMLWDEVAGSPHAIDFLHPRRRPAPASRRRLYVRAGLLAVLVLVSGLGYVWTEAAALDNEVRRLEKESLDFDAQLGPSAKTEQAVAEMEKWQAGEVVWLEELKWLSEKFPRAEEAMLTQFQGSTSQRGTEASLEGLARSVETVTAMEQKLCDTKHQVVGKDKGEDVSRRPYSLRFRSTLHVKAEGR